MPRRRSTVTVGRSAGVLFVAVIGMLALGTPSWDGSGPDAALAQSGSLTLDKPSVPVRVQIPSLDIDLPVMSSRATLPGNPPGYPLCDVAQYWDIYDLPGAPGTAWIFAHAQPGMFLPLLEEAVATNGQGLLDRDVEVQLRDGRVLIYRISEVRQHSVDRTIAERRRPGAHRLVLQTSEGPAGTIPKLMMAARLIRARVTDEPAPKPRPRVCSDAPRPTPKPRRTPEATPVESGMMEAPSGTPGEEMSVLLGAGALFLGGSLLLTVWLRRRPIS